MKKPPALTDLSNLPVVLTVNDMLALYRIHYSTLRRGLKNGTFSPRPWNWGPPRWDRDEVLADLKRRRPEPPSPRQTGFALAAARRAAKAPLPAPPSSKPRRRPASNRAAS